MQLRLATLADARILFAWRNDPLTRAMSVNAEPLQWDDHIAWLTRRLGKESPDLYVAELDGVAIGTVRLDGNLISYTIAPEHRGKRLATAMLAEAARRFGPKVAELKPDNTASIRAAEAAGHRIVLIGYKPTKVCLEAIFPHLTKRQHPGFR